MASRTPTITIPVPDDEVKERLDELCEYVGKSRGVVLAALVFLDKDIVKQQVEKEIENVKERKAKRLEAKRESRRKVREKLSDLTPAQLEALLAQAEKLKDGD